jgi:hypothetical protein
LHFLKKVYFCSKPNYCNTNFIIKGHFEQ